MNTINTSNAPAAIGPYSQAKTFEQLIFTSGQIPIDPATGKVSGETITEQAHQSLKNLAAVLEAGNSSLEHVLKTTCFLSDMADFAAFNEVYASYMKGCPARSCVAVKQLPLGVLCEVEAIAVMKSE